MDAPLSERERLKLQIIARAQLPLAEERAEFEDSLINFVEAAWPSLDPSASALRVCATTRREQSQQIRPIRLPRRRIRSIERQKLQSCYVVRFTVSTARASFTLRVLAGTCFCEVPRNFF
jgi:hypothetical protein